MKKIYVILVVMLLAAVFFPTPAQAESWSKYRIMLDPGHGGSDPGALGPKAPNEATLVLRCGLALRDRIVNELGGTVEMTRETDEYVELSVRREKSVSYDPYIFCSIHLNSAKTNTAKGTETYYYHSTGNSKMLAEKVQPRLIEQFNTVSGYTATNRGVKYGNLAVIKGSPNVPAILTEGLFINNEAEWSILNSTSKDGFHKWVHGHLLGFYDRLVLLSSTLNKPGNATTPDVNAGKPTITYSPESVTLSAVYGDANQPYQDVTIKGENLEADIKVNSISGGIVPTTLSGWDKRKGGTLRLTLNTKFSLGASPEPRTGYVAVESGSGDSKARVEIPFSFTLTAPEVPSGLENIELTETPVYYNLQGIRVENPQHGLCIRVQGGKATKVFLP